MKTFNGKAIYNPSGKAGEYTYWACNFYVGCSNNCTYCYCKKGVLGSVMGGITPTLKKCFKDEENALEVFGKELIQNVEELQKSGLFFSFTTDPMLPECIDLTWDAVGNAIYRNVPVKILTKCTEWVSDFIAYTRECTPKEKSFYAFGFTLTGHDELEPNASTNSERIEAMAKLHDAGFKTFASIEPIIDITSSISMIRQCIGHCDLFKVGLLSGKKYSKQDLTQLVYWLTIWERDFGIKVYLKDTLISQYGTDRGILTQFVTRDFNLFK
ncbi:MAG: radical SAM protein [Paludibacter sp.]